MTSAQPLDPRLRVYALLLVPGFVGHTLQLTAEDTPWNSVAYGRYFWTPGWHQALSPWVPTLIAFALIGCVLGLGLSALRNPVTTRVFAWKSPRFWLLCTALAYSAHYLTYPFRIRNHMSHMLASLGGVLVVWLAFWLGERKERARTHDLLGYDDAALRILALMTCVTYFYAGLHKFNWAFLDLRVDAEGASVSGSSAVDGLTTFSIYGDLGSQPWWLERAVAAWGTVFIEMVVPILAWRLPRIRTLAVSVLMLFHVPHVAVMDVADYPMIACASYAAFFSREHAEALAPSLRLSRWNVIGAALGIATQLWFMPFWGRLTIFGILVLALWGYAMGSFAHAHFALPTRGQNARPSRA